MDGGGFGRIFTWAALALVCLVLIPFALFTALLGASSAASCGSGTAAASIPTGAKGLPPQFVPIYAGAAQKYQLGPRGFGILAAIHHIESGFGQNMGPSSAGAIGQMQFMPATWAAYGQDGNGDGKKDPYNPWDAIFGAANYLHASGLNPHATEAQVRNAILAYNHADWYVDEVLAQAAQYNRGGAVTTGGELPLVTDGGASLCGPTATGPANLNEVETLYRPRSYRTLPASAMAPGHSPEQVDARIYADAIFVIQTYELRVTAAREAGHLSHGNGLSLDLVPAAGKAWENTTERFARDIGWRPGCDNSCEPPVIRAPGWVRWIGYNGATGHGDPAHCSGSCGAHLHVSWLGSSGAQAALVPPDSWVKVFPVGSPPDPSPSKPKKGKRK